jgi:hypothetical protein
MNSKNRFDFYFVRRTSADCRLLLLILMISFFATSCAYHAGFGDRRIPGGYQLVSVPVFKNSTDETGVEVYFTNAIIREIERSKVARVVDKSQAQVVIEGTIEFVRYVSTNQVKQGPNAPLEMPAGTVLTTEYRILVKTMIRVRRLSDQVVIWQGDFNGERSYLAPKVLANVLNSADALYNHSARYQNINLMAVELMSEAHNRMTENF